MSIQYIVIHRALKGYHCLAPSLLFVSRSMAHQSDSLFSLLLSRQQCTVIVPLRIAPLHHRSSPSHSCSPKRAPIKPLQPLQSLQSSAETSQLFERRRQARPEERVFIDSSFSDSTMGGEHRRTSEVSNSTSSALPSAVSTPASSIPPNSSKEFASGPFFSKDVNNPILVEAGLRRGSAPHLVSRGPASHEQDHGENSRSGGIDMKGTPSVGRMTRSGAESTRRLEFKLHSEFLLAQSSLFRKILSSNSPLDLSNEEIQSKNDPNELKKDLSTSSPTSAFPNLPEPLVLSLHPHPVIFLPLPDPCSFRALVRFLYFGEVELLDKAMKTGQVRWEGIVANSSVLGLNSSVKRWLGLWYKENSTQVTKSRKSKERERTDQREKDEAEINYLSQSVGTTLNLEENDLSINNLNDSMGNGFLKTSTSNHDQFHRPHLSTSPSGPTAGSSPSSSGSQGSGDDDSDTTMTMLPANKLRRNSFLQKDVSLANLAAESLSTKKAHPSLNSTSRRLRRPTSASNPRPFDPNPSHLQGSPRPPPSSFHSFNFDERSATVRTALRRTRRPHSRA